MNSPWGIIQYSTVYCQGVKGVSTAGHGGIMVTERFANKYLSEVCRKRGIVYQEGRYVRTLRTYYCYEEDCDYALVEFELLNLFGEKMHEKIFSHLLGKDSSYSNLEGAKKRLLGTITRWNSDYLIETGIAPDPEIKPFAWTLDDYIAQKISGFLKNDS